jgi:hypothetical protein
MGCALREPLVSIHHGNAFSMVQRCREARLEQHAWVMEYDGRFPECR